MTEQYNQKCVLDWIQISRDMRFPTMLYVRPAKAQTSLRRRAVWSEPLLVACIFYEYQATDWPSFGVSKLKRRLHMLVRVYTCQNTTLLEITSQLKWALSWENLSLRFVTWQDSNHLTHLQRLAKILNFLPLANIATLLFYEANNDGADQTTQMPRLVCTFAVGMPKSDFSRQGPNDNYSFC